MQTVSGRFALIPSEYWPNVPIRVELKFRLGVVPVGAVGGVNVAPIVVLPANSCHTLAAANGANDTPPVTKDVPTRKPMRAGNVSISPRVSTVGNVTARMPVPRTVGLILRGSRCTRE